MATTYIAITLTGELLDNRGRGYVSRAAARRAAERRGTVAVETRRIDEELPPFNTVAYHFVGATLRDGRPVPPDGVWLEHDGPIAIRESGLHASRRPWHALQFAPGGTLCLVEVADIVAEVDDKLVARRRRIVRRVDLTEDLREFARQCARDVMDLWEAPDVVRRYLESGDETLREAARAAARGVAWPERADEWAASAAWAAAMDAEWAAARDAAKSAAWAAAKLVAREASWASVKVTAREPSRDSAWDVVREAVMDAAWEAVRDVQSKQFDALCRARLGV